MQLQRPVRPWPVRPWPQRPCPAPLAAGLCWPAGNCAGKAPGAGADPGGPAPAGPAPPRPPCRPHPRAASPTSAGPLGPRQARRLLLRLLQGGEWAACGALLGPPPPAWLGLQGWADQLAEAALQHQLPQRQHHPLLLLLCAAACCWLAAPAQDWNLQAPALALALALSKQQRDGVGEPWAPPGRCPCMSRAVRARAAEPVLDLPCSAA